MLFQNNPAVGLPKFQASEVVSLGEKFGQEAGCANTILDETKTAEDNSSLRTSHTGKLSVQVQLDCGTSSGLKITTGTTRTSLSMLHEIDGYYKSTHVFRNGKPLYAVKQLRDDLKGNKLDQARVALAAEASLLGSLPDHPNICMVQGTFGEPGTDGFSIVTDHLTMNLREKMRDWKKYDGRRFRLSKRVVLRRHQPSKGEQLQLQNKIYGEKLMAVYDVAQALLHLAENRIIFRYLKPENVGVDVRGDMRLFNFGQLAKELKDEDLTAPGMYRLTGMTGSRPYMAPEVLRSKSYGLSADVYSFAILVWEVMSNCHAYPFMTSKKTIEKRKAALPEGSCMHDLVRLCCCHESRDRLTIKQVCDLISAEIELKKA